MVDQTDPADASISSSAVRTKTNLYASRGGPASFDAKSGKYDIEQYSYPNDLMADDNRYGGNYVIFYINVATDSKLLKNKDVQTVEDFPPRDGGDLRAQNLSKNTLVAGSALGGAAAGGLLSGNIKGAVVGGGIAGIGTGVAATMAPDATRSQKRLKTAIALHVPNQLNIRYGTQWSEEDTGFIAATGALGKDGMDAITAALKDEKANAKFTGTAQAVITNLALSKGPNAGAASAALGLTANPKKEQVFKGVDFRSFTFDYQFYPRSPEEAQNVLNIIKQFKYHMHPEFKDAGNFVYIYPSEFDIFYYNGGVENLNLHRHTSCVLTELSVNYTPNGAFTTFENGMPTQINVQMGFRELALLTKDKIEDGL